MYTVFIFVGIIYNKRWKKIQILILITVFPYNLQFNFYRFSISWSRILPTGDVSSLNQKGIDYYNKLIDDLIAANIEPVATMLHYDLPQPLQDLGGYANPVIVGYFESYANILYSNFGDRVSISTTVLANNKSILTLPPSLHMFYTMNIDFHLACI